MQTRAALEALGCTYQRRPPDNGFVRRKGPNIVDMRICVFVMRNDVQLRMRKTPADLLGVHPCLAWEAHSDHHEYYDQQST